MIYHSTRHTDLTATGAQAICAGIAPDGGLYVPQNIPKLDLSAILEETTQQMAVRILSALFPDLPDMEGLVRSAYTGKFQTEDLTPTVEVGDLTVLELFRGPTSAFKDVALCMLSLIHI